MTPHPAAESIWSAILPEIRATRRRRRIRRAALGAASAVLLGWALFPRAMPPAPGVTTVPTPPAVECLAVYRITASGSIRLEMVEPGDLGATELPFGLTPVVLADNPGEW
ncbi:MAG: hypothetical protein J0M04_09405 [Verrucomicrobia bacterium]|nr:hypothetical protein [Verrucomicrobiota bacterium]